MEEVVKQSAAMHRTMRDLIALSALPAVWVGYQPHQIAEGVADALLSTLGLDLIYVRVSGRTAGQEIEISRRGAAGEAIPANETRRIAEALKPFLNGGTADPAPSIPNPAGGGMLHLVVVRIGEDGVLVAGAGQTDFPSQADRLLLTVAANQAAAVLQRRRAEQALRESEQRFRTFVDHATDAFFLFDDNNVVLDVNRQACESLGYTREELLGSTPLMFDPDVTPAILDEIKRRLDDGQLMAFESRHRRKDGTIFPVEVRGQAFLEGARRFRVALARDNTGRKQGEAALRESEARFRGTFENAAIGIANVDFEGRWLRVNQRLCDIVGYTREELLQKTFQEITHPDDLAISLEKFIPFTRGNLPSFALQKRYVRKDGSIVWVELFESLQRDAAGEPAYVIVMIQDISERKRLEEELRESEHRWRSLTEALPQLVWTAMPDGACDYFSTQWTQYTGVPTDELLGWQWLKTLHPDDREPTRQFWTDSVAGRHPYDVEYRVRRSDGEYRWFKTRGVPIRESDGRIFKWFGSCTDITTSKQLQDELRHANERLDLAVRGSNIALWENDMPDGDFRRGRRYYVNAWEQLGYHRSEIPSDAAPMSEDRIHPDERAVIQETIRKYLAGETDKFEIENRLRHKDGSYHWVLTRGVAVRDEAGKPIRFVGSAVDITDRKRLEEELRGAKEAAESANRAKDEFLANVSHEIRTPMNAIMGLTSLVLGTDLDEGQRQSLVTVKSAANNLLGIINDLLDFSKIEAHKLELHPGEFSLRATLSDTMRALAMRAHQKGLELVCNVHSDVPEILIGDAGRLRQVLLNLIGNAVKFTAKGEVVVQVSVLPDSPSIESEVRLLFTIRDTGIGIPKEKQTAIFRAFEQEDSSTTRKYGGTGLGLTISAQLAALMGGKIEVDSEPGRGSTFSLTARFGRSARPITAGAGGSSDLLDNLRVLIVDDNVTNRQILEEWVHNWSMQPVAVGDGAAAVAELHRAARAGAPYALVLLDGRMPDGDGLTIALQMRQRAEISSTRIILLTSEDSSTRVVQLRKVGIDAYLLKPVQQSELLETIGQVMGRAARETAPAKAAASAPEAPAFPAPAAPLRILVAEDNEFNVILLKQLFAQRGHIAHISGNGREAVAKAVEGAFDVLLLDIHMPEMDGFAVAQAIREQERSTGKRLPIIAFTARTGKADRERCLAAGMDDFLSKPVQAEALWEVIDRVVRAHASPHEAGSGLLDPRAILAACGGDANILNRISQAFRATVPDQMAAVARALREKDAPRLREAAHALSSTLAAFSAVGGSAASKLEDEAAQGLIEECKPLVTRLESMCSELVAQTVALSIEKLSGAPRS